MTRMQTLRHWVMPLERTPRIVVKSLKPVGGHWIPALSASIL